MNLVSTNELTNALGVTPQRVAALAKQLNVSQDETLIKGRSKHYTPAAVRKILSHRGVDYSQKEVMAFCNNKGGVGKTSIAINTALRLSSLGFKVLLIDADPQANATSFLLRDHNFDKTLFNVIAENLKIEDTVLELNEYLNVVPSTLKVEQCGPFLMNKTGAMEHYFKKMFEKLDYNFIIWDLSPSLSMLNYRALLSCSTINIVSSLSEFSVQGLEMQNDVVESARSEFPNFNPKTKTIINMFDSRMTSALEFLSDIKEIGVTTYQGVIRIDNNMNKAQTTRRPLPSNSNAAKDINSLVDEIIGLDALNNANVQ